MIPPLLCRRSEVADVFLMASLLALSLLHGCLTLEQRWEQFDTEQRQEIGVKTKEGYLREWGKPAKRVKSDDGGEAWTWEFSGYGGAQGWKRRWSSHRMEC